jgi:hypothetical protein
MYLIKHASLLNYNWKMFYWIVETVNEMNEWTNFSFSLQEINLEEWISQNFFSVIYNLKTCKNTTEAR